MARGILISTMFIIWKCMIPIMGVKSVMHQSKTISKDGSYRLLETYDDSTPPNMACGFSPNPKQKDDDRRVALRVGDYGLEMMQMRCPGVTYSGFGDTISAVAARYDTTTLEGDALGSAKFQDPLKEISSNAHTFKQGARCSRVAEILEEISVPGISNVGNQPFDMLHNKLCVLFERAAKQAMGQDVTPHLQKCLSRLDILMTGGTFSNSAVTAFRCSAMRLSPIIPVFAILSNNHPVVLCSTGNSQPLTDEEFRAFIRKSCPVQVEPRSKTCIFTEHIEVGKVKMDSTILFNAEGSNVETLTLQCRKAFYMPSFEQDHMLTVNKMNPRIKDALHETIKDPLSSRAFDTSSETDAEGRCYSVLGQLYVEFFGRANTDYTTSNGITRKLCTEAFTAAKIGGERSVQPHNQDGANMRGSTSTQ